MLVPCQQSVLVTLVRVPVTLVRVPVGLVRVPVGLPVGLVRVPVALVRVPVGLVRVPVGLVRVPVALVRVPVGLVRVPVALAHVPASLVCIPESREQCQCPAGTVVYEGVAVQHDAGQVLPGLPPGQDGPVFPAADAAATQSQHSQPTPPARHRDYVTFWCIYILILILINACTVFQGRRHDHNIIYMYLYYKNTAIDCNNHAIPGGGLPNSKIKM